MTGKKIIRPAEDVDLLIQSDLKNYIRGEWLVTNGLGGYASSTIIGVRTRKYHGLLISALPPPFGRTIMLNHLREEILDGEKSYLLNCEEKEDGTLSIDPLNYLKEFYLEDGLPVWLYEVNGIQIEKRILMTYRQNTVYISYKLLKGPENVLLKLSPALHFCHHEAPVNIPVTECYVVTAIENRYEIKAKEYPPLKIFVFGESPRNFTIEGKIIKNVFFRIEAWRGYESTGDLWNPGYFLLQLNKNKEAGIVASTESWSQIDAIDEVKAKNAEGLRKKLLLHLASPPDLFSAELVLAADQFIITPESRIQDTVRAHAFGEEIRTVIAGYHWFTDWGRDTMISLEGLTLSTKRYNEARWILKTFSHYVKNGLIPNMFPDGKNEGLYHTADATLWFFHAIDRYLAVTKDPLILEELLPILKNIISYHINGTEFGIGIDPNDKLMRQGAVHYQLTWMDAKVGDWVVTPRRGKAVEINALWYNALRLMQEWTERDESLYYANLANETYNSFNEKFWIQDKQYLYDVIEGEKDKDDTFRPNQLFSISLKYPVLDKSRWKSVVDLCKEKLLTPFGLRTLAPEHPDFKSHYEGDLRSRDAAYHQGTVWPWLIGPFVDSWQKVYPDDHNVKRFLEGFLKHLSDAGVGTVSEIFDATPPYNPQGCMAQAWSVAEVLRCWLKVQ